MRHQYKILSVLLIWLTPQEAHAWGLYSHVAYTHALLGALPLLPLPLLQAIQRFPELVMAGACLPDLAVVSRRFKHSHGWGMGQQLLQTEDTASLAIGIGYNCHLLTDVVAHQHFVPTFEAKWNHHSVLTHATAEWAMDAFLSVPGLATPGTLLLRHQERIVETLSILLDVDPQMTRQALRRLAYADQALRLSRLPHMLLYCYQRRDHELNSKLDYYHAQVMLTLHDLPAVLAGHFPSLHAEHIHLGIDQLDSWRRKCLRDARLQPARAIGLFEHYQHQWLEHTDS